MNRVRVAINPYTLAVENFAKAAVYSGSPGRRGNKVRLAKHFSKALRAIEEAAQAGRLADRFPERVLLL